MFKTPFQDFVCAGDSITCKVGKFTAVARVYRDDCSDKPDQRDDGFWPSLDPKSAGFIGEGKGKRHLAAAMGRATRIMNAWLADEWFYCGVAVTVECEDVTLTAEFDAAVWGIDCNYPGSKNEYLLEVANELLPDALATARAKLELLCKAEG